MGVGIKFPWQTIREMIDPLSLASAITGLVLSLLSIVHECHSLYVDMHKKRRAVIFIQRSWRSYKGALSRSPSEVMHSSSY